QALDGLQQFYLFADALVAVTQQKADSQVLVFDYAGELKKRLPLNQQGQVAWVSRNGDFASNQLRLRSMSMTTPPMWQELNVKTLDLVTLSRDIYQNYHAERYVSEQVIAHQNGVEGPITLA
ncbi:S9 family peptidase, partial [Vibrio parahaemolyticus]|nr:S9 family peptidase [Vibrio parahaemolyticus]